MSRIATLLILLLLCAPPASAQYLQSGTTDPQTGESVPLGGTPSAAETAPVRGGPSLDLLAHLPEGSTKLVRAVDGGPLVIYQNGADLIAGTITREIGEDPVYTELDRFRLEGQPTDMVIDGTLAFVTLQKNEGLLVLDISDPTALTAVGQLEGASLFAVAVEGDYAYVGKGTAGLAVYDISDLGAITEVVSLDTPGSANGLAVNGSILYVADGNNSSGPDFRTYDVSNPTNPQLLGTYEAGGFVTYVAIGGDIAYLTGGFGLHTLDVSDPANPTFLGSFDAGGETTYEVEWPVGGHAVYIAGLGGAFFVDVFDPTQPFMVMAFTDAGQGLSIARLETEVLLADRFEGLRILDGSLLGGQWLPQLAILENGGFSHKGYFDGNYLYVTELAGTLRILDLGAAVPGGSGPIQEVGRIDVPPNTQEVLVRDGIAYVTDADSGPTGLTVVDVSDPANPAILGGYGSPNQAFGLDLYDDLLFLANGFTGLQTLDVSNPATPVPLDAFPMASSTNDVAVVFNLGVPAAFATTFGNGLFSIGWGVPTMLEQLDAETGWGFLNAIALSDEQFFGDAYVADGQQGLRVVFVSDPTDIQSRSTTPTVSQARDVAAGVYSDEGTPEPAAYVAADFYGLQMFRVEPTGATVVASNASADRGIGVAVAKDRSPNIVALMAGETGVYFYLDPSPVAAAPPGSTPDLRLAAVAPNPVRSAAAVRYTLPEAGPVRLAVYDLLGRQVALLADGTQLAGSHTARLDAARLPSGVYVVRLTAGDRTLTTKATVVH